MLQPPCYVLCLFWWLPGWSLCLCVTGEDLVHTTKVNHHVYTLFLAYPLPWTGHLMVGQEQAGSPLYVHNYEYVFCKQIKVNNTLQTCMSQLYFSLGGVVLLKLSWCDFEFLLVTASSA